MNKIWRAPWGRHIDLSRILEVTEVNPPEQILDGYARNEFGILYMFQDKHIFVNEMQVGMRYFKIDSEWNGPNKSFTKDGVWHQLKEWRDALIMAWTEYKQT